MALQQHTTNLAGALSSFPLGTVLRRGPVEDDKIRLLQKCLNRLGCKDDEGKELNPDGFFGKFTKQAIINFQIEHGLKQDGAAGRETLAKLRELINNLERNTPAHRVLSSDKSKPSRLGRTPTPQMLTSLLDRERCPKIVLDAGHGDVMTFENGGLQRKRDHGAVSKNTGLSESKITLELAYLVREKLKEWGVPDSNISLSRTDNKFVANNSRVTMAEQSNAWFVSLHVDSGNSNKGRISVYHGDPDTRNNPSRELAEAIHSQSSNNRLRSEAVTYHRSFFGFDNRRGENTLVEVSSVEDPRLKDKSYLEEIAAQIASGIVRRIIATQDDRRKSRDNGNNLIARNPSPHTSTN